MKRVPIGKVYAVLENFVSDLPTPVAELVAEQTGDPFKVLVTTILTARTKDTTTVEVIKTLFDHITSFDDLKRLPLERIRELIYPVGFYKNKAQYLKALPYTIEQEFDGRIPDTVDELTKLPGVGRKTANLVVATAFHKPAICVDIHVHRITNRLGYVRTQTPFETEMALRKKLPEQYWITFNTYLVAFGQHTCTPVSPHCSKCPIEKYCNKIGVTRNR
ncbi:MAG: endonuclease III domain-containing protein [Candidatus Woesearchaeota archaeon]